MFKKCLLAFVAIFTLAASGHAQNLFTGKAEQKSLEVALAFLHNELPDGYAEGRQITTIKQEPFACTDKQSCHQQTMITLTIDGLADDSVKAQRHILILEQAPGQPWSIIKQDISWACWPRRGHTDFSNAPCV